MSLQWGGEAGWWGEKILGRGSPWGKGAERGPVGNKEQCSVTEGGGEGRVGLRGCPSPHQPDSLWCGEEHIITLSGPIS